MSLFKTKELWSASCDNDLFDLGCMRVGNIGVNRKSFNSIITGSYNGILRIYNPSETTDGDSKSGGFKAHDMVLEMALSEPILQIEIGKFVNTSSKMHIAVLTRTLLNVYEAIAISEDNIDHGNQYSLKFVYQHILHRSAYNMCSGSFGGLSAASRSDPHEYICVQAIDGMLSIYEYESYSMSCFLPKVLVPGPFKYVPKTDSFLTVTSHWELESYRYQTLATTSQRPSANSKSDTANLKHKKIVPEFTYNIGEAAIDIAVIDQQVPGGHTQCSVLILGERNLFCFTETCTLKFMRKFELNPAAFCAYPIITKQQHQPSVHYLVATHSKLLFVHDNVKVAWAAQIDHVPVQIAVARINNLEGVIVSLSEDGKLKCAYLGTEPAFTNREEANNNVKEFDFQSAEGEYRRLQTQIKSAIMNTGMIIKQTSSNKSGLNLTVNVPPNLDSSKSLATRDTQLSDPLDSIPSLTCKILLNSAQTCHNIKLNVNCKLPIVAVPDTVTFSTIGGCQVEHEVTFYMKTRHVPSSLDVSICASYSHGTTTGPTRLAENSFRLPLKLVMKSGNQLQQTETERDKASSKNIVLESNRGCVSLIELFPELSGSYSQSSGVNAVTGQFYGSSTSVSVGGAKSGAGKYRVQADNFESMWLLTQELVVRLNNFYAKLNQEVEITYREPLPTDDLKLVIDEHLALRKDLEEMSKSLEQCCVQFRAIQKRLLTKFKDKSPTSLDNMDALLEATYRQVVLLADKCLRAKQELSILTSQLNCMSSLYVLLLGLVFKFSKDGKEVMSAVMTSNIEDTAELGWEEIVNAAVSNLIRTALSKAGGKEGGPGSQVNGSLKLPADSSKLEKQLKSVIGKLESGAMLLPSVYKKSSDEEAKTVNKPGDVGINESVRLKHEQVISKELNRIQEKIPRKSFDEKKPFGSIKLPSYQELEEKKKETPIMKAKKIIESDSDDDKWTD